MNIKISILILLKLVYFSNADLILIPKEIKWKLVNTPKNLNATQTIEGITRGFKSWEGAWVKFIHTNNDNADIKFQFVSSEFFENKQFSLAQVVDNNVILLNNDFNWSFVERYIHDVHTVSLSHCVHYELGHILKKGPNFKHSQIIIPGCQFDQLHYYPLNYNCVNKFTYKNKVLNCDLNVKNEPNLIVSLDNCHWENTDAVVDYNKLVNFENRCVMMY